MRKKQLDEVSAAQNRRFVHGGETLGLTYQHVRSMLDQQFGNVVLPGEQRRLQRSVEEP